MENNIDYATSDGICLLGGTYGQCSNDCNTCKIAIEYKNRIHKMTI